METGMLTLIIVGLSGFIAGIWLSNRLSEEKELRDRLKLAEHAKYRAIEAWHKAVLKYQWSPELVTYDEIMLDLLRNTPKMYKLTYTLSDDLHEGIVEAGNAPIPWSRK